MSQQTSNGAVLTVTASATVSNRNCVVTALALNPAAAACSVSLYDPLPNSVSTTNATLKVTLVAPASVSTVGYPLDSGIEFANGCIAVVTGVAATANVGWQVI